MRPIFTLLLFVFAWFVQAGCNGPEVHTVKDANVAFYDSIKHLTALEFQPAISRADSIQLVYYDNPDGEPQRYTRFYKWVNSNDPVLLIALKQAVNKHFERVEVVKECRSEGKVYFFERGNPVQTVYFSNRGDSCSHLYYIADGWFYYMAMDSATALKLRALKGEAITPAGR